MGVIGALLLIIFAITAVFIITIVLLQDEQGEGFGGLFGGGGSATPFGAAGGNILVRITTILGVIFMVASLLVAMAFKSGQSTDVIDDALNAVESGRNWFMEDSIQEDLPEQ